jgi:AraC family ethanolamine operon transcriptional activator
MRDSDPRLPNGPGGSREIRDFDQLAQLFSHWNGQFEQVSRGAFAGTIQVVSGRRLQAHYAKSNQVIRVRGREHAEMVGFHLVGAGGASCLWQGRRLDVGSVVVRGSQSSADHLTSKPVDSRHLSIPEATFRIAVMQELGFDPGPISWRALRPRPDLFAALAVAHSHMLHDRIDSIGPSNVANEDACLSAVINLLYPIQNNSTSANRRYRDSLACRAEDVMRHQLSQPLTEVDLCRVLNVTGRTLRLAMKERFGMGPMAYLQTLRLNAAREALKNQLHQQRPVETVAHQFGFFHLGKFANYYQRLFGESPSETHRLHQRRPVSVRSAATSRDGDRLFSAVP